MITTEQNLTLLLDKFLRLTFSVQTQGDVTPRWITAFMNDPVGNSLAVLMLVIMIMVLVRAGMVFYRGGENTVKTSSWLIPVLAIAGLGVATYLTFIEFSGEAAICGPVGDCNVVQQSEYAKLFGVIPVGLMGMVGYIAILVGWAFQTYGPAVIKNWARLSIWIMSIVGILFTVYLTFLEPFIIGATCMWCITSAAIMTAILWISTGPGVNAYEELIKLEDDSELDKEPVTYRG